MSKKYNLKEIIYSTSTHYKGGQDTLVYGTVKGSATVLNERFRVEPEIIISSRMGDVIHISDLHALKGLACVLNQIVKDMDECVLKINSRWEQAE